MTYDVGFEIEGVIHTCSGMGECVSESEEIRASRLDGTKHIWVYQLNLAGPLEALLNAHFVDGELCFTTGTMLGEILIQDVNNSPGEINARYFFDALDVTGTTETSYAFTMHCWVTPGHEWLPGADGAPAEAVLNCTQWTVGNNSRKRKNIERCGVEDRQDFSDDPAMPTNIKVFGPSP